jgi:hypothetical protein
MQAQDSIAAQQRSPDDMPAQDITPNPSAEAFTAGLQGWHGMPAQDITPNPSTEDMPAQDITSAQDHRLGDTFPPLPRSPNLAGHAPSTTILAGHARSLVTIPLLSGTATISPRGQRLAASMISHGTPLVSRILDHSLCLKRVVKKTFQFQTEVEHVSVASSPLRLRAATAAPAAASAASSTAVAEGDGLGGKRVGLRRKLLGAVKALPAPVALGALVAATNIGGLIWFKCCRR